VWGFESGVVAVTSGGSHSCVVTVAGALKCWGLNDHGQLGNGTLIDSSVPVQVQGLSSGVVAAEAGAAHTCALLKTGVVSCWGDNSHGQLGDNTTTSRLQPTPIAGLGGFAVALKSGAGHSCALLSPTRILRCWGDNQYGQIGDGTTTRRLLPVSTTNFSGVVRARAKRAATLASGWRLLDATYAGDAGHSASSTFIPHEAQ
jgi:alpha-tubulin suppressor-like RCC1 family protein